VKKLTAHGVAGSISGTRGTTFFLIPVIGTHAIALLLGVAGSGCRLCLMALNHIHSLTKDGRSVAGLCAFAVLMLAGDLAWADGLFDEGVRAEMLKHADGRVAHVETKYYDLYINKHGPLLALKTRFKGCCQSLVDLKDPDNMPLTYAQTMTASLLYPEATKRILMIGLGAGSISTYLGRAMPDVQIDVVELDSGVIAVGKKYFGLQETEKVHFIESDGRVYLNRHKDLYDLILLDAYRDLGVPFHLLTQEFYSLVKERLSPGGAAAFHIGDSTKLYLSTLVTLRAVFQSVDTYPDRLAPDEARAIAVAMPTARPSADTLTRRAVALQNTHRFRYPLPDLVGGRLTDQNSEGGLLLTDDFAPVNLHETIRIKPQ
jgi:spermidine synthase